MSEAPANKHGIETSTERSPEIEALQNALAELGPNDAEKGRAFVDAFFVWTDAIPTTRETDTLRRYTDEIAEVMEPAVTAGYVFTEAQVNELKEKITNIPDSTTTSAAGDSKAPAEPATSTEGKKVPADAQEFVKNNAETAEKADQFIAGVEKQIDDTLRLLAEKQNISVSSDLGLNEQKQILKGIPGAVNMVQKGQELRNRVKEYKKEQSEETAAKILKAYNSFQKSQEQLQEHIKTIINLEYKNALDTWSTAKQALQAAEKKRKDSFEARKSDPKNQLYKDEDEAYRQAKITYAQALQAVLAARKERNLTSIEDGDARAMIGKRMFLKSEASHLRKKGESQEDYDKRIGALKSYTDKELLYQEQLANERQRSLAVRCFKKWQGLSRRKKLIIGGAIAGGFAAATSGSGAAVGAVLRTVIGTTAGAAVSRVAGEVTHKALTKITRLEKLSERAEKTRQSTITEFDASKFEELEKKIRGDERLANWVSGGVTVASSGVGFGTAYLIGAQWGEIYDVHLSDTVDEYADQVTNDIRTAAAQEISSWRGDESSWLNVPLRDISATVMPASEVETNSNASVADAEAAQAGTGEPAAASSATTASMATVQPSDVRTAAAAPVATATPAAPAEIPVTSTSIESAEGYSYTAEDISDADTHVAPPVEETIEQEQPAVVAESTDPDVVAAPVSSEPTPITESEPVIEPEPAVVETERTLYTPQEGDRLWAILDGRGLDAANDSNVLEALTDVQQNEVQTALRDYMITNPEFTTSVGIASGHPDRITPNDQINLASLEAKLLELAEERGYDVSNETAAETAAHTVGAGETLSGVLYGQIDSVQLPALEELSPAEREMVADKMIATLMDNPNLAAEANITDSRLWLFEGQTLNLPVLNELAQSVAAAEGITTADTSAVPETGAVENVTAPTDIPLDVTPEMVTGDGPFAGVAAEKFETTFAEYRVPGMSEEKIASLQESYIADASVLTGTDIGGSRIDFDTALHTVMERGYLFGTVFDTPTLDFSDAAERFQSLSIQDFAEYRSIDSDVERTAWIEQKFGAVPELQREQMDAFLQALDATALRTDTVPDLSALVERAVALETLGYNADNGRFIVHPIDGSATVLIPLSPPPPLAAAA